MNGNKFNYVADGAIPPFRIVKFGAGDDHRALAGLADVAAGVTLDVGCSQAGDRIDVQEDGEARLQVGGTVAAGDWLKSDAFGRGIVTTEGAVAVQAKEAGTLDAIIRVNITRFTKQAEA